MQGLRIRPEAAGYLADNGYLIPDVWAGLLVIRDADKPVGRRRATLYVLDVLNHWIYYKWISAELKEVEIIKPKQ